MFNCYSAIYRQRTYLLVKFVDILKNEPDNLRQEVVNRIIKTHLDVAGYMKNNYDDDYWKSPEEEMLDPTLIVSLLLTFCNFCLIIIVFILALFTRSSLQSFSQKARRNH